MNKRLTGMAAVCILAAALTGCGGNSNENTGKATGTPAVTQSPLVSVSPESPEATMEPESTEEPAESVKPEGDNASKNLFEKSIDGLELPSLADMPEDMFADSYGLDTGLFQSYTVQMPLMNVQATEVGIFELKDKADTDTIKKGIEKRAAALQETWKTYLPDQYELVQQYKIEEKGDFILFVIAEDANAIVVNFMNAVK